MNISRRKRSQDLLALAAVVISFVARARASSPVCAPGNWVSLDSIGSRSSLAAVWTGSEIIVWGGHTDSGYRLDPTTGIVRPLPENGAPSRRFGHVAVWTGHEMIIWGGHLEEPGTVGAIYNPDSDLWRSMSGAGSPATGVGSIAAWSGEEMIVFGGDDDLSGNWTSACGIRPARGGRYNPVTDRWRAMALPSGNRKFPAGAWTGSRLIVWGGVCGRGSESDSSGFLYDPAADRIEAMSSIGAPVGRRLSSAVWTGAYLVVWGGIRDCLDSLCYWDMERSGGRYDPVQDRWLPMATSGAPDGVFQLAVTSTSAGAFFWGGRSLSTSFVYFDTGAIYDPAADAWSTVSDVGSPARRCNATAIDHSSGVTVVGGENYDYYMNDIKTLRLPQNAWTSATATQLPTPRFGAARQWTGSETIVWGGSTAKSVWWDPKPRTFEQSGSVFDPFLSSSRLFQGDGYPEVSGNLGAGAVWSGKEFWVVAGGRHPGRFDPESQCWRPVRSYHFVRSTRAAWGANRIFVFESASDSVSSKMLSLSVEDDDWTDVSSPLLPDVLGNSVTMVGDPTGVYLLGGQARASGPNVATFLHFDAANSDWKELPACPLSPRAFAEGFWTGSQLLIWGGEECNAGSCNPTGGGAIFDPTENSWTTISRADEPIPSVGNGATWGEGGLAVVGIDPRSSSGQAGIWRWKPDTDSWEGLPPISPTHLGGSLLGWAGNNLLLSGGNPISDPVLLEFNCETSPLSITRVPSSANTRDFISFVPRTSTDITRWQWTTDDGQTSTRRSPSFRYSASGDHSIHLSVTGRDGAVSTAISQFVVSSTAEVWSRKLVVPIVVHSNGVNGSVWQTELILKNPSGSRSFSSKLEFVQSGVSTPALSQVIQLGPNQSLSISDVLHSAFGIESDVFGSLWIQGDSAEPTPIVVARISTASPTGGSYGELIPAFDRWSYFSTPPGVTSVIPGGAHTEIPGLVDSESRRTNIGIFNPNDTEIKVLLDGHTEPPYPSAGTYLEVEVPPRGVIQLNSFGQLGSIPPGVPFHCGFNSTTRFLAYASLVDNQTNDPTIVLANPRGSTLRDVVVDGLASASGDHGTSWKTEVAIFPESDSSDCEGVFFPREGAGTEKNFLIPLETSIGRNWADFLAEAVNATNAAGAIQISASCGQSIYHWERTYTSSPKGTYGQALKPLDSHFGTAEIIGGRENQTWRTNLGILGPGDSSLTVHVEILDSSGAVLAGQDLSLIPHSPVFLAHVAEVIAGTSAIDLFTIRIAGDGTHPFTAWASIVDNVTGDGLFLGATSTTCNE